MIVEEDPSDAEVIPPEGDPPRSRVAQALARWGTFSYRLALLLAVLSLLAGGTFAALTPAPLWHRLMSFVFVGFPPALAAYLIGWLTFWTLRGVSEIYDPVSLCLWQTFWILVGAARIAWRFLAWIVTDPLPSWWANIIAFLRVCRRGVERAGRVCVAFALATSIAAVWAFGRVKRTAMRAANILARWALRCVRSARMCAQIAYRALRIACVGLAASVRTCRREVAWFIRQIVHALIWMCSTLLSAIGACMELALACERATARLLFKARRYCGKAWRLFIFSATSPVRLVAQILIRLIPSAA